MENKPNINSSDYSIVNYFNWHINGTRSKGIESGTKVNKNIEQLNNALIDMVEKYIKGIIFLLF
jgi:hypothetical protein